MPMRRSYASKRTYSVKSRDARRVKRRKLGTPSGVLVTRSPNAPKPYLGPGADVKWNNSAIELVSPYTITMDSSGSVYHINEISKGVGQNQRIGNAYRNIGVHLRGYVNQTPASAVFAREDTVRICLVWDTQPQGALPVFNEIMQNTILSGASALPLYPDEERFKIFWSKTFTWGRAAGDSVCLARYEIDEYIGFPRNFVTKLSAGSATGGSISLIRSGGLYLLASSCTSAASTGLPEMRLNLKHFFDEKSP